MNSDLTFTFNKKPPNQIVLRYGYKGPKNPKKAEYNSGKGWTTLPHNVDEEEPITLPIHGNQISFRGDWRDENGAYRNMFNTVFTSWHHVNDVVMSGTLEYDANDTPFGYANMFSNCDGIISMKDNPLPKITGKPAECMLMNTFFNMSGTGLNKLPEGFLDLSELSGKPASNMLLYTCTNMKNVSTPYIFKLGSGIEFDNDIVNYIYGTWLGMKNWTGTVMWGDKVLFDAITLDYPGDVVTGCKNMRNYKNIHKNWR